MTAQGLASIARVNRRRERLPHIPAETEKHFMAAVIELAERLGYLVYHPFDSRRSREGFPDLVLCSPSRRRVIFAELKRDGLGATMAQVRWLTSLHMAGAEAYTWHPSDLPTITRILTGGQ